MPTAAQARVLLAILAGGDSHPTGTRWPSHDAGVVRGWITPWPERLAITPDGRDALARWLYRTCDGRVVVVPEQVPMSDGEAPIALDLLIGRDPRSDSRRMPGLVSGHLSAMWRKLWIDAYDRAGPRLRDALAAYLLRGVRL